jgi:hypothetical protein
MPTDHNEIEGLADRAPDNDSPSTLEEWAGRAARMIASGEVVISLSRPINGERFLMIPFSTYKRDLANASASAKAKDNPHA